jgi:uncharacterized membrane protein YfcA
MWNIIGMRRSNTACNLVKSSDRQPGAGLVFVCPAPSLPCGVAPHLYGMRGCPKMNISTTTTVLISVAVFAAALLFAIAGHTGASAYLAIFGLLGMAPTEIKPSVLALNVVVGCVAVYKFTRAGHFSWRLTWPFILTSIPFSFLGGLITLPTPIYRLLVGVVLVYASFRMLFDAPKKRDSAGLPGHLAFPAAWGRDRFYGGTHRDGRRRLAQPDPASHQLGRSATDSGYHLCLRAGELHFGSVRVLVCFARFASSTAGMGLWWP